MVKGVNRQVIEILQPEDPCFERAIFFLSPQGALEQQAQRRAQDYLRQAGVRLDKRSRLLRRLSRVGEGLFWALCGAGATGLAWFLS